MIIDHIQQNEARKRGLKPGINLEQMSSEVQNRDLRGLLFSKYSKHSPCRSGIMCEKIML